MSELPHEVVYHDYNNLKVMACPHCECTTGSSIQYTVLPDNAKLVFTDESGAEHVHHVGDMLDVVCKNCEGKWLQFPYETT